MRIDGRDWPTVEHYFQAMKAHHESEQEILRLCATPKEAKEKGRSIQLRPDWERIKEEVMFKALLAKFTQHEDLRRILLGTGNAPIHEDDPHDREWGYPGQDKLGRMLMRVRETLRKGAADGEDA